MQKAHKHWLVVKPPIVAERVFIKVRLKVPTSDAVINPCQSTLEQAPEPFHGISVRAISQNVDASSVLDAAMRVSVPHMRDAVISNVLIGEHCALGKDVLFHQPEQRSA